MLPLLKEGQSYVIHVDKEQMAKNAALPANHPRQPIIRVIGPDNATVYCHSIKWNGVTSLVTDYEHPLPDRPSAICVVRTQVQLTLEI